MPQCDALRRAPGACPFPDDSPIQSVIALETTQITNTKHYHCIVTIATTKAASLRH